MKWLFFFLFLAGAVHAEPKSVRVFVALCDNKSQGIIPVGEKIGNGDDPDGNLYWGCSDGFGSYFKRSKKWEVVKSEKDVSYSVMRRMELKHKEQDIVLIADAYRGSEIRNCYIAFEKALASKEHDLVAFIGHNVLMDTTLPDAEAVEENDTKSVILCCHSYSYCRSRLDTLGSKPLLLTQQLMYPGSFLLHDAIESWRNGGSLDDIRSAAGRAYAKNQGISVDSGTNIFAKLTAEQEG